MVPTTMRPSPLLRAAALAAGLLLVPPAAWSKSAKEVFRQAAPSVVVVLALGRDGATTGQGSGVVVDRTEVVTNCHVVEDAAGIAVRQASDHTGETTWRMKASVLTRNDERDLCLLYVDQLSDPPAPAAARLGSAKTLSVGEEVYAIGAPRGLELSLSRGIVSQLRGVMGKRRDPLIQTDAAISPGSSGGGLFNANGELVGITTFKRRGENLNFALPADWVRELQEQRRSALEAAKLGAACAENLDFDCLIKLARWDANRIEDAERRLQALAEVMEAQTKIADSQVEAGELQAARKTLAAALKTAQNIEDVWTRAWVLQEIAAIQVQAGKPQAARKTLTAALKTAQNINDAGARAVLLSFIAAIQAKVGEPQAARKTLSDALKIAQGIDDPEKRARRLNRMAKAQAKMAIALAKAGNVADALQTAQESNFTGYY